MGKGLDGCRNVFKKRAKKCLPPFLQRKQTDTTHNTKDFNRKGTGTWVSISTTVV